MTSGGYLIQPDGNLIEWVEQEYDSEDLLQSLLADYPSLLAGDQIDPATPRQWLLIAREMNLPSDDSSTGRWSVDHLFVDQDAIPTIIEVKRSSDTRIRREVVGQVLEYAANATLYWPIERIRAHFDAANSESQQQLADFLGNEGNPDQFWQQVDLNLKAGKIRLIFVADQIPLELQRIVEFLNEQMNPAQVLAVEVKQYIAGDLKRISSRVIGQTIEAQDRKSVSSRPKRQWDEESFLAELEARRGSQEAGVAKAILDWGKDRQLRMSYGNGLHAGSVFPVLDLDGENFWPIGLWTYGRIEIQFQNLVSRPPFDQEIKRLEFRELFHRIPNVNIALDRLTKRPSILFSFLLDEASLSLFIKTLDWFLQEVKSTYRS